MKYAGIVRKVLSTLMGVLVVAFCWFGVWRLMDEIIDSDGGIPSGTVSNESQTTNPQTPSDPVQVPDSGQTQPGGETGSGGGAFVPTEAQVLALRDMVTKDMTEDNKSVLHDAIVSANIALEHRYFYDDFFEQLMDPESLYWNYFEKTGEIQIGWAEGDDGARTEVMAENDFVVENYVARLQKLKDSVVSGLLDQDFDRLMELLTTAKRDHDGASVEEFYHMIHDMDYFLMRYGLTDVGPYVQDTSTVTLYYGSLAVWKNQAEEANQAY